MKKKNMGKLALNRETVRELASDELGMAVGGVTGRMSVCVCYTKPTNCSAAPACNTQAGCLSDACP